MKLFLVILVAGKVGGSVGPLPCDMAECLTRAGELQDKAVKAWDNPEIVAKLRANEPTITRDTYQFRCRMLPGHPEHGTEMAP